MKTGILIALLILTKVTLVTACRCAMMTLKEKRQIEFSNSTLIMIGDVVDKTSTFQVKLVELFRGDARDSIFTGSLMAPCSSIPKVGRWLFYVTPVSDGVFTFFSCGLSRSFERPNDLFLKRYLIDNRRKSLRLGKRDLEKEIRMLRKGLNSEPKKL